VTNGGTGASSAKTARENLGIETKYKTADQTISSATYGDDNHLAGFTLAANGVYAVEGVALLQGTPPSVGFRWVQTQTPADSNFVGYEVLELNNSGTEGGSAISLSTTTNQTWSWPGGGSDRIIKIKGTFFAGSSAGTTKLQLNASSGSFTIRAGSWVTLRRLDA